MTHCDWSATPVTPAPHSLSTQLEGFTKFSTIIILHVYFLGPRRLGNGSNHRRCVHYGGTVCGKPLAPENSSRSSSVITTSGTECSAGKIMRALSLVQPSSSKLGSAISRGRSVGEAPSCWTETFVWRGRLASRVDATTPGPTRAHHMPRSWPLNTRFNCCSLATCTLASRSMLLRLRKDGTKIRYSTST